MQPSAQAAVRYTVADLTYDAATHTTTLPDGRGVPHVTAILHAVGVSEDFGALGDRSPRLAAAIAHAGARGTAVHADCHAYDDDDLDWDSVDPRVRPYVEAWAECREAMGLTPVERERQLYHPDYCYTGFMDGIFRRGGRFILGDLKTGDPNSAACHLQTAAYMDAYLAQHPEAPPVDERWAIWLRPGHRVPYAITNYSARPDAYTDSHVFAACVTVYHAQAVRRPRLR